MSITRVSDLLSLYTSRYSKADVFAAKPDTRWVYCSSADFIRFANELSGGLLTLGLRKGDKVGIMSGNRPEWNFVDFGAMQIGLVTVPLYPNMSEHDLAYILKDAEVKALFIDGPLLYEKLRPLNDLLAGTSIFSFEKVAGLRSWDTVRQLAASTDPEMLASARARVAASDLLTLIYTSGTTGDPKGVMLTHKNIVSNMLSCESLLPEGLEKALSFLPLCHIFERMVSYLYLYKGISIYYAQSIETIADNIKEVRPHVFTTVPRLLEKVYDKIVAKGADLGGVKKALFYWALGLGLRYDPWEKGGAGYRLALRMANRLIFTKWRQALGGRLKVVISGGAALQPRLARVFNAADIPVVQGYGLSETSPVIAVNFLGRGNHKLGSVGRPVRGVEVKIAGDGEILCRGDNVMEGYFRRPEATAREIDKDGWFHTGDIGRVDEDGFLFITGRKKEFFKTAGGKYVSPPLIENKFKESPFIEYIVVVGENRRFPAALIVPEFGFLKAWCERKGISCASSEEMVTHPDVLARYHEELQRFNRFFGQWEQVKKFTLIPRQWSIDSGELTPKLDVKRKIVMERHAALIEQLYET